MKRQRTKETRNNARELRRSASAIDEKIVELLEPDVLAAEEYQRIHRRHALSSEQDLMAAILEQGIADYRRYVFARDKKGRKFFLDAEAWISIDDHDWVFSFTNCCGVVGIEPSYLRRGLGRWQQSRSSEKIFHKAA
jgi:hypothetical protein